jgi:hypothetical protein
MIPDLDIWRAANLLIEQHGADAEIVAAQRADALSEAGDVAVAAKGADALNQCVRCGSLLRSSSSACRVSA